MLNEVKVASSQLYVEVGVGFDIFRSWCRGVWLWSIDALPDSDGAQMLDRLACCNTSTALLLTV